VQSLLNSPKNESERGDSEKPEEDDDQPRQGPQKMTPQPTEPDTSGLPSLPPPTPGNQ
jgi:hypothetical protein